MQENTKPIEKLRTEYDEKMKEYSPKKIKKLIYEKILLTSLILLLFTVPLNIISGLFNINLNLLIFGIFNIYIAILLIISYHKAIEITNDIEPFQLKLDIIKLTLQDVLKKDKNKSR